MEGGDPGRPGLKKNGTAKVRARTPGGVQGVADHEDTPKADPKADHPRCRMLKVTHPGLTVTRTNTGKRKIRNFWSKLK